MNKFKVGDKIIIGDSLSGVTGVIEKVHSNGILYDIKFKNTSLLTTFDERYLEKVVSVKLGGEIVKNILEEINKDKTFLDVVKEIEDVVSEWIISVSFEYIGTEICNVILDAGCEEVTKFVVDVTEDDIFMNTEDNTKIYYEELEDYMKIMEILQDNKHLIVGCEDE